MSEQEPIEIVDLRNEVTRLQEMLVERDCEVETLKTRLAELDGEARSPGARTADHPMRAVGFTLGGELVDVAMPAGQNAILLERCNFQRDGSRPPRVNVEYGRPIRSIRLRMSSVFVLGDALTIEQNQDGDVDVIVKNATVAGFGS